MIYPQRLMIISAQSSVQNHLLRAMSVDDFARIHPHLIAVDLKVHDVLVEADEPIAFVYFIESGVSSLVMTDDGGLDLEIAVIGREGMSAVALLQGLDRSSHGTFVQIAGSALRIRADVLLAAMNDSPTLRASLTLFAHSIFTQVSRSALTYGRYKIPQRLVRWLLMCHDRIDDDDIQLTHNFLSLMLGVHRPNVTMAIHKLEGMHGIKATRGRIRVLDRGKLEEIAGGCYGALERRHASFDPRQPHDDQHPGTL